MEIYQTTQNDTVYVFHVLKNMTEPCPQCGVPACGREDILWYECDEKRISIIFDGGYFDLARDEFFDKKVTTNNYASLPVFLREWNECRGWEDCSDYDGYTLQIDDFILSMELLKQCESGTWITSSDIQDIQELAQTAKEKGCLLKIVRG